MESPKEENPVQAAAQARYADWLQRREHAARLKKMRREARARARAQNRAPSE